MGDLILQHRIDIWKAIPTKHIDDVDKFIEDLIDRVEELEKKVDNLENEILEMGEYE